MNAAKQEQNNKNSQHWRRNRRKGNKNKTKKNEAKTEDLSEGKAAISANVELALPLKALSVCHTPWRAGVKTAPVQLQSAIPHPTHPHHRAILAILNRISKGNIQIFVPRILEIIMPSRTSSYPLLFTPQQLHQKKNNKDSSSVSFDQEKHNICLDVPDTRVSLLTSGKEKQTHNHRSAIASADHKTNDNLSVESQTKTNHSSITSKKNKKDSCNNNNNCLLVSDNKNSTNSDNTRGNISETSDCYGGGANSLNQSATKQDFCHINNCDSGGSTNDDANGVGNDAPPSISVIRQDFCRMLFEKACDEPVYTPDYCRLLRLLSDAVNDRIQQQEAPHHWDLVSLLTTAAVERFEWLLSSLLILYGSSQSCSPWTPEEELSEYGDRRRIKQHMKLMVSLHQCALLPHEALHLVRDQMVAPFEEQNNTSNLSLNPVTKAIQQQRSINKELLHLINMEKELQSEAQPMLGEMKRELLERLRRPQTDFLQMKMQMKKQRQQVKVLNENNAGRMQQQKEVLNKFALEMQTQREVLNESHKAQKSREECVLNEFGVKDEPRKQHHKLQDLIESVQLLQKQQVDGAEILNETDNIEEPIEIEGMSAHMRHLFYLQHVQILFQQEYQLQQELTQRQEYLRRQMNAASLMHLRVRQENQDPLPSRGIQRHLRQLAGLPNWKRLQLAEGKLLDNKYIKVTIVQVVNRFNPSNPNQIIDCCVEMTEEFCDVFDVSERILIEDALTNSQRLSMELLCEYLRTAGAVNLLQQQRTNQLVSYLDKYKTDLNSRGQYLVNETDRLRQLGWFGRKPLTRVG